MCTARGIACRAEVEEEGGGTQVVNTLVEVATPEYHARFHVPDQAGVLLV